MNDTAPNDAPAKPRQLKSPPRKGGGVKYAQRYRELRQRVDTAVRLLNKAGATPPGETTTIATLVKVAIEELTGE